MKKLLTLTTILFFVFSACTEESPVETNNVDLHDDIQKILTKHHDVYLADYPNYIGGYALQVKSPKGNYFVTAGMNQDVTNQSHFRAASNTKTFTSAAIHLLHDKGLLNVHHKIIDIIPGTTEPYIPDTPEYNIPYKDEITIWQLLSHNAGAFDVTNDNIPLDVTADVPYKGQNYSDYKLNEEPNRTFTFDEFIGVISTCKLSYFQPGTGHHYSNNGFSLLGKIIERISGKSYQQFLMDEFVIPLGLTETTFPDQGDDQTIPTHAVTGYIQEPGATPTDVTESNMSANVAEGNVLTTADNLSEFIKLLLTGNAGVSLTTINNIMMDCRLSSSGSSAGYGGGLIHWNNLGYGHNGGHEGFLSLMVYDPETDIAIVGYTNSLNLINGSSSIMETLTSLEEVFREVKATVVGN